MGQYFRIANLDKRETLDPFKFGSGLKLTESCYVGNHYVDAITHLLANDWHGDRVLLCGDYAWSDEDGVLLTAPDGEIRRAVEVNGLDWNHVSVADLAKAVERMGGDAGQERRHPLHRRGRHKLARLSRINRTGPVLRSGHR